MQEDIFNQYDLKFWLKICLMNALKRKWKDVFRSAAFRCGECKRNFTKFCQPYWLVTMRATKIQRSPFPLKELMVVPIDSLRQGKTIMSFIQTNRTHEIMVYWFMDYWFPDQPDNFRTCRTKQPDYTEINRTYQDGKNPWILDPYFQ